MLQPEMQLVTAVTSLNLDGLDNLGEKPCQFVAVFSASRHCIHFFLAVLIILPINYVGKKTSTKLHFDVNEHEKDKASTFHSRMAQEDMIYP